MAGAAAPAAVWAQTETNEAVARIGGQAQALAELCANMTQTELDARKKEQAQALAKRGIGAARFETLFNEGHAASKTKIEAGLHPNSARRAAKSS